MGNLYDSMHMVYEELERARDEGLINKRLFNQTEQKFAEALEQAGYADTAIEIAERRKGRHTKRTEEDSRD